MMKNEEREYITEKNIQYLYCLVKDILETSNMHKRGSNLKTFLLNDLEQIKKKSNEIFQWILKNIDENEEFVNPGKFILNE